MYYPPQRLDAKRHDNNYLSEARDLDINPSNEYQQILPILKNGGETSTEDLYFHKDYEC